MKKLFSLLLACMLLFLTACNQTPPNETTNNSQNQEKPEDSVLKDTIIKDYHYDFIDTSSRILFVNPISPKYTCYYSKADGKAYVYCFDPLCDHSGEKCLANPHQLNNWGANLPEFKFRCTFFINNRFYTMTRHGQIYSFAFDGSDLQIEYGPTSYTIEELNTLQFTWDENPYAYGKYIYIRINADENGNPRTLRFNTETKEMEDLTEKTGNAIMMRFFYNEEIYGLDAKLRTWVKADLDLKKMEPIEEQPTTSQFYGSVFFDFAYERIDSKTDKYLGIQSYDMKTGETKIITNEMLGLEEANQCVVASVDETYIYFYQYKKVLLGERETHWGVQPISKYNEGKLYRVKHDGTECTLIYDNPNFEFNSREAVICGNQIILEGSEYSVEADGYVVCTSSGMQIGTMGEDGKIEKFKPIELVY